MSWYRIKQIAEIFPAFTEVDIRNRVKIALDNNMWACIKRSNTSILIHRERFERWIEDNDCLVNELKKNGKYEYRLKLFKQDLKRSQEIFRGKV